MGEGVQACGPKALVSNSGIHHALKIYKYISGLADFQDFLLFSA